jgi:hypothetical protein
MNPIPRGPDHLYCPQWRKKMSAVCHTCPLWVQLRGRNPQTGDEVDSWQCSLASLPMLLIENAQQTRQNGAATESLRNELVSASKNTIAAAETFQAIQDRKKPNLIDITPKN